MEDAQTLDQQIAQQKAAEFQQKVQLFLQEFDALQRKHGVVLVPRINHGVFGALTPDFQYISQEDFEKATGQKLNPTPQGETN